MRNNSILQDLIYPVWELKFVQTNSTTKLLVGHKFKHRLNYICFVSSYEKSYGGTRCPCIKPSLFWWSLNRVDKLFARLEFIIKGVRCMYIMQCLFWHQGITFGCMRKPLSLQKRCSSFCSLLLPLVGILLDYLLQDTCFRRVASCLHCLLGFYYQVVVVKLWNAFYHGVQFARINL